MKSVITSISILLLISCGDSEPVDATNSDDSGYNTIDGTNYDTFVESIDAIIEETNNNPDLTNREIAHTVAACSMIKGTAELIWHRISPMLNRKVAELTKSETEKYLSDVLEYHLEPLDGLNASGLLEFAKENPDLENFFGKRLIEFIKK